MIDIKLIRENPDLVKQAVQEKNMTVDIDRLLAVDERRRAIETEFNTLRHEQKKAGEQMANADKAEKAELGKSLKALKDKLQGLTSELEGVEAEFNELMLLVPQIPHPEALRGTDESQNQEVRRWGEPKKDYGFELKDHIELGNSLGMIDFERGVKIAGSRNYVLTGKGAMLHEAVLRLAWDTLVERGYVPMSVPVLVADKMMYGSGFFPMFEEEAYRCERDAQSLVGTSEVPVTGFHMDEILDADTLPKRFVCRSTCFRREAGAAGKDTRGLYRVHYFDKVEQVIVCKADVEESAKMHDEIIANTEAVLQMLELPYRVIECCTGDLQQGKARAFDLETWMPSRGDYCETHSASRYHDFQARRFNMRFRDPETGKPEFCHTLNNTVVASPRILIPIMEQYQNPDGTITVPKVLRPYMGGLELIS